MTDAARLAAIRAAVRVIPDFPQPGIQFRDITPLMADPVLFADAVALLADRVRAAKPDVLVAVEARGFLFGAPIAVALGLPLVPVRKAGKLPSATHAIDYGLEYGQDRLELHQGALQPGARAIILDDLLATGGTVRAAAQLVSLSGGEVAGALFLIELSDLGGRTALLEDDIRCEALISY